MNSSEAASYLGVKERTLRTSRSTNNLKGIPTPAYSKEGKNCTYTKFDLDNWLDVFNQHKQKMTLDKLYIVWNKERTEAFTTTNMALAVSVQNGDWDACEGYPVARAFCDNYSESSLTNVEMRLVTI